MPRQSNAKQEAHGHCAIPTQKYNKSYRYARRKSHESNCRLCQNHQRYKNLQHRHRYAITCKIRRAHAKSHQNKSQYCTSVSTNWHCTTSEGADRYRQQKPPADIFHHKAGLAASEGRCTISSEGGQFIVILQPSTNSLQQKMCQDQVRAHCSFQRCSGKQHEIQNISSILNSRENTNVTITACSSTPFTTKVIKK